MNTKNLKSLLVGGLMVATLGFVSVGCNENDVVDPPTTGGAPSAPTAVKAVSLSSSSVGLSWTAAGDTGTITYRVDAVLSGTVPDTVKVSGITGTSTTITGLQNGKAYTFNVYAVRDGLNSTAASVIWAAADRYTSDAASSTTIKMYEKASSNGSGLTLDPASGGPTNVSVSANNPNPGQVQLAIFANDATTTGATTFKIGPAFAMEEYKQLNNFNQNTYISDSVYAVPSLSAWYDNIPLNQRINTATGNISYFTLQNSVSGSDTYMFYVRTGTSGNYHYARILVKNNGGKVLQGTSPNRYVELEISYQSTPDVPYAKVPAGAVTPRGVVASQIGK